MYKGKNSSPSHCLEREQQCHPHSHDLMCSWGHCCRVHPSRNLCLHRLSAPKSVAARVWGHPARPSTGAAVSAVAPFPCSCSFGVLPAGSVLQSCAGTRRSPSSQGSRGIFYLRPCPRLRLCVPSPGRSGREIAVCSSGQTALLGPRDCQRD